MFVYCLFWLKQHNARHPNFVVTSVLVNARIPKGTRQPTGEVLTSKLPCHLDTNQNGHRNMLKSRVTSKIKWIALYVFLMKINSVCRFMHDCSIKSDMFSTTFFFGKYYGIFTTRDKCVLCSEPTKLRIELNWTKIIAHFAPALYCPLKMSTT